MEIAITLLADCALVLVTSRLAPRAFHELDLAYALLVSALLLVGASWSRDRRRRYPGRIHPAVLLFVGWFAAIGFVSILAFFVVLIASEEAHDLTPFVLGYGLAALLLVPGVFVEHRLRVSSVGSSHAV